MPMSQLNIQTIQFFFYEVTSPKNGQFPLLMRAIELLCSRDPMVRVAAQTTILNVYRVDDDLARSTILQPRYEQCACVPAL